MDAITNPLIIEDFAHAAKNAAIFDTASADVAHLPSCSDCAALILAYDSATTPLKVQPDDPKKPPVVCGEDGKTPRPLQRYQDKEALRWAIAAAKEAGAKHLGVVTPEDPDLRAQVEAVALAEAGQTPVDFAAFCAAEAEECRKTSANFELYGVSEYLLKLGRQALENCGADHLLVMACDQVRITATHLRALRQRMEARPDTQVVASWIVWLRRLPLLISGAWLRNHAAEDPAKDPSTCTRAIVQLTCQDVVFGEEHLEANATVPEGFSAFFKDCKISALQAVRLAKKLDSADDQAKKALLAPLTDADKQLLDLASLTVSDLRKAVDTEGLADDLAWANAWGARNKLDFPLLQDRKQRDRLVFLDSAATAQRVGAALEDQHSFDTHENANVYRGGYDLSMQATLTLNDARKTVEDFIGANRRETIYTSNTSGGANLVAQCWGSLNVGVGDLIITSIAEHHSNLLPWMLLAESKGARLAYLPLDAEGGYDLQAYAKLLEQRPKLVCLAQIGNVMGIINPLETMIADAKAAGAFVFVDGAQGLPHLATDVRKLGCDFYAFSGHKLYGPLGIGGLWVNPDRYPEMTPAALGGGTVSHVSSDSYYLRLGAIGYECGTPPISQAVGLAAAVRYLDALGMENVARHSQVLTRYLMAALRDIDGVTVWGNHDAESGQSGLVSLSVFGMAPGQVGATLGQVGVAVRAGGHCALPLAAALGLIGTTRISLGVYNTAEDVEAAAVALRLCRQLRP